MASQVIKKLPFILSTKGPSMAVVRSKTTSSQYVASNPTFEKLMDNYKNLLKVIAIQGLILTNRSNNPPSVSLEFLNRLSQKLHLNRGAAAFLRKYPHIFDIFYEQKKSQPFCRLTNSSTQICRQEAAAITESLPLVVDRLVRILSMSASKSLPLRAIFKVWREFGLPDDFEDSVISKNPHLFKLCDAHEPNTHILKLVGAIPSNNFVASAENWRITECCKEDSIVDRTEMQFTFKHGFPPGMRLSKNFRAKVKEWQRLPYVGPYEDVGEKKRSKSGIMALEKRTVGIVHEFLSLPVEKTVEVEKISHFRNCFGIDLNIRDLFLDHPGIFYLSTKGKRHTVFLREAYEKGCLIEPNPVYNVRRKLLDLVLMGHRGLFNSDSRSRDIDRSMEDETEGEESG
ncbi:LOW QUALITY PROTEIN: protein ROOT PRIMORDIUM DEFECTIVE 1 [Cornus florida]|uniref:LOW QUALITY PROTEIN: protein ROOT PRIMORDIUM DEFECTIVE 1 n=1 Tax=Cornus florida TaxID=4283 RepID=UPI0028995032|nr:LOW QUALITY PROTEIN: protein ROOT PRIMORDIUM DEFECTIVE 1 [Cornus florida]